MGTDIHAFVEYDTNPEQRPFAEMGAIHSVSLAEFDIERNYELFDRLAAARESQMEAPDFKPHMRRPKGIPNVVSYAVARRWYVATQHPEYTSLGDVPLLVFPPFQDAKLAIELDKVPVFLNPEWHSASWMSLSELEEVVTEMDVDGCGPDVGVRIVIVAMRMLEERYGEGHSRLVFWFDC